MAILLSGCSRCSQEKPATPSPATKESKKEPAAGPVTPPPMPTPVEVRRAAMRFELPTKNHALYDGDGQKFYMFVDRSINGQMREVWEGGQYGFVRDPVMAKDGSIHMKRFHEGMDIAPVQRDEKGEPLDTVHSIADGTVVLCNYSAGKSNYGMYVIVRHDTESGPFFSLYAHLSKVTVARGMALTCGDQLGVMGHTGTGIDRRRSHLHLEINMLINAQAAQGGPYDPKAPAPDPAGALRGGSLMGIDGGKWFITRRTQPSITLGDFIKATPPYWKLRIPNTGKELSITKLYPWMRLPGPASEGWEIAIAGSGIPISVTPIAEKVEGTIVSWVQPTVGYHRWNTRELLEGTGHIATLSRRGVEYVRQISQ